MMKGGEGERNIEQELLVKEFLEPRPQETLRGVVMFVRRLFKESSGSSGPLQ